MYEGAYHDFERLRISTDPFKNAQMVAAEMALVRTEGVIRFRAWANVHEIIGGFLCVNARQRIPPDIPIPPYSPIPLYILTKCCENEEENKTKLETI